MSLAISSGILATGSTTTLQTGKSILSGVVAISDLTNPATVIVYDNTAASGTVLAKVKAPAAVGVAAITFPTPVRGDIGLTVVVSGTGAEAVVTYGA